MANGQAEKKGGEGCRIQDASGLRDWADECVMAGAGEGRGSAGKFCGDWDDWESGAFNEKYLVEREVEGIV